MLEQKWTLDVESNQYELIQGKLYLIGSSEGDGSDKKKVDIMLKSQGVDGKHCVLEAIGTTLCIYDLHSELGTFVNGKRLDSMLKEIINDSVELCIGEVAGRLYPKGNKDQRAQLNSSATEMFIVPTQRAPRSSLSNTSTRLFSSPDVSMVDSTADDYSFNIPETQHIQQRVSIGGNSSLLNTSAKSTTVEKSANDDSFIPETQMVTPIDETTNQNAENIIQQSLQQQTDELIRMCTQDFNENLFGAGVDEETFTSLIIPNIQHAPVVLTNESVCNNMNKGVANDSAGDAEMEALNWSEHTSKCATIDESEQNTQCLERDDVCTPDLFDFPELAEVNKPEETKAIDESVKSTENHISAECTTNSEREIPVSSGDGYAEEIDMMPTQVFIPKPKLDLSHFADPATQVFIPKPKRNEVRLADANATTENTELSLSGKENIPHTDFCPEQTQIFPITTKDVKAVDNKCNLIASTANKATIDVFDRDLSLLPPTQLFPSKSNSSEQQSKTTVTSSDNKKIQNLNSTVVLTVGSENAKSVASFFADMEDTTDNSAVIDEKIPSCFKKPKRTPSSSKSTRSKDSVTNITYWQNETEDLQLCTPKWIVDNFDELTVERNADTAKKRMLFGSDSEDELEAIELNNLVTKKDSKDFERLLVNVNYAKPPTKVVESTTSVLIKQEEKITHIKRTVEKDTKNVIISKSNGKQFINKGEVQLLDNGSKPAKKITRSSDKDEIRSNIIASLDKEGKVDNVNVKANVRRGIKSPQASGDSKEKPSHTEKTNTRERESSRLRTVSKEKQRRKNASKDLKKVEQPVKQGQQSSEEIIPILEKSTSFNYEKPSVDRDQESVQTSRDNKDKKGTKKSASHHETGCASAKRVTRLRSRTSDLDVDKAGSSTLNPSEAKKRRTETKEDSSEISRKRVTRSRSKTDSQESLTSTKISSSTRKTKTGNQSTEEKEKITRKDSCGTNSGKTLTSATERKRKVSTDTVSSDDETKRLRSTTRTLQVAMTMVEPKLFQCLLNNSPGNWCLASDPTKADILVMDKGNRTLKFLIAIAKGIPIVTSNWLESLNSTKTVPRGITHFFKDKDFEKRHKFSLLKSLELARKRKLFEGYDFLTTPSILPQPPEIKQIIECAGGKVHSETPPAKPNQNIYVISSWNDKKHWHKYRRSNANIRITSSEGIMESVMRQITTPLDTHVFV